MHFERIRSTHGPRYAAAMALYRSSFPAHELRTAASQARALTQDAYQFRLIFDEAAWVGLLLCWDAGDFFYIEHVCTRPELRGRRYGQAALALLAEEGKPIILEIDPPVGDLSRRRQGFYERAGYHANPYAHVHPPYHAANRGHALVVMSYPDVLSADTYAAFADYLKHTVMAGEPDD